ncbi:replicative DNA helicase [Chryseobacterium sp. DT-3]|uniref:replicative DNA helicase n=1 Tax=Chryseobacterium sp. DT-3 TaxID=3396164 RepID=UPI003F193BAE
MRKKPITAPSITDGNIPPNAVDFERLIIGTLLVDKRALDICIKRIGKNENVFYEPKHSLIYKTIQKLNDTEIPIDLLTLIQELKRNENLNSAGGDQYIVDLTMNVSSSAHLEYHIMIIWQAYLRRKMINLCNSIASRAYNNISISTPDLFAELQGQIHAIEEEIASQQETPNAQSLFQRIIERQKQGTIPGIQCHGSDLNRNMSGWRNGTLNVIGARPAMGKTAFVLDQALHIAKRGEGVAFVSLEMSAEELQERQMANDLEISGNKFRDISLSDYDWQKIFQCTTFENLPLFIIEAKTVKSELSKIKAKLRLLKKEKDIKLIIWDYIQLTEIAGIDINKNREQVISTVARNIKQLAQELDVPIIALSQLSRTCESRPGKRPQMADLRESGAIEQDADVVGFLFRPEYYKISVWDNDPEGQQTSTAGEVELMIEKFRGGSPFTSRMKFRGDYQKYYPLEEDFGSFKNPVPMGNINEAFGKQNGPDLYGNELPF